MYFSLKHLDFVLTIYPVISNARTVVCDDAVPEQFILRMHLRELLISSIQVSSSLGFLMVVFHLFSFSGASIDSSFYSKVDGYPNEIKTYSLSRRSKNWFEKFIKHNGKIKLKCETPFFRLIIVGDR